MVTPLLISVAAKERWTWCHTSKFESGACVPLYKVGAHLAVKVDEWCDKEALKEYHRKRQVRQLYGAGKEYHRTGTNFQQQLYEVRRRDLFTFLFHGTRRALSELCF